MASEQRQKYRLNAKYRIVTVESMEWSWTFACVQVALRKRTKWTGKTWKKKRKLRKRLETKEMKVGLCRAAFRRLTQFKQPHEMLFHFHPLYQSLLFEICMVRGEKNKSIDFAIHSARRVSTVHDWNNGFLRDKLSSYVQAILNCDSKAISREKQPQQKKPRNTYDLNGYLLQQ